ncbi:hypothetical protein [Pantoea sp. GM01]|uniref:hypothetical protein n=1 Tax=Pantoea sp. GM01 TaxID=1144320 RepID=UPI000271165A|nr:hypothetical protein [Pantoea sp. GM01]EJL90340.1 hypothetical protein PMI17_01860 [Pantoea sp. GM01]
MNRSYDELMKDRMIGEALLALLEDGIAISPVALIAKLEFMAEKEEESYKKAACQYALTEIRSHSVRTNKLSIERDFGDATFSHQNYARDDKKH